MAEVETPNCPAISARENPHRKRGTKVLKQLVRSGDRRGRVVKARRLFCQLAVRGIGYPWAEVARYLGVTTSAVNRLAVSEALADLKQYRKLF